MEKLSLKQRVSRFIVNWVFLIIVWIAFTGTIEGQEFIAGVVVTILIALFTSHLFTCCTLKLFSPIRLFHIIHYLFVFVIALLKSNLDVARRVLSPSLPINPGIVKFKTKLSTDYSRMVLANCITLTPGTLSIDIIDDTLYVHWIDVTTTDPEEAFTEIAEKFETILLKIF